MSSVGYGFLKAVIANGAASLADIDKNYFIGAEKLAYDFILKHFQEFNSFPRLKTIALEINNSACFDNLPNEPPEYWLQKIKERKRHSLSITGLSSIREKLENADIDGAVNAFESIYESLQETYVAPENAVCDSDSSFPDVMTGLAGDFAVLYSSYLESPREFFYMAFLTCLGATLSDRISLNTELAPQPRLYTILLGESADTRKSTALDKTVDFFDAVFPRDTTHARWTRVGFATCYGAGSAEGLAVSLNSAHKVLLYLDELKPFISKCKIENSVLLPCVTTLFEANRYENRTKKSHINIDDAYLTMIAACTVDTWEAIWTSAFTAIGFTNRLFIVPGSAARKFSLPQMIPQNEKDVLINRLRELVDSCGCLRRLSLTESARERFHSWYMDLPSSVHTKRLDTYGMRLMPLLAVNQGKDEIDLEIVQKVIRLCDWQLLVRQTYDPIDSDNQMSHVEEKVRRALATGPLTERDLQRKINYQRVGVWFYQNAIKNLKNNGEIRKRSNKTWELIAHN